MVGSDGFGLVGAKHIKAFVMKCNEDATSNKRASLLGARTLLGALLAFLLVTRTLLVTKECLD